MSAANGSAIRILGTCKFTANFPETQKSASVLALVACDTKDILISWHDLISLGWDMRFLAGKVRALTEESTEMYKQFELKLMCKFDSVFSDELSETPMKAPAMRIRLRPDAKPFAYHLLLESLHLCSCTSVYVYFKGFSLDAFFMYFLPLFLALLNRGKSVSCKEDRNSPF